MSNVILPLILKLLYVPPLTVRFLIDLLIFLVYALVWKPYLAAALLVPMYGRLCQPLTQSPKCFVDDLTGTVFL